MSGRDKDIYEKSHWTDCSWAEEGEEKKIAEKNWKRKQNLQHIICCSSANISTSDTLLFYHLPTTSFLHILIVLLPPSLFCSSASHSLFTPFPSLLCAQSLLPIFVIISPFHLDTRHACHRSRSIFPSFRIFLHLQKKLDGFKNRSWTNSKTIVCHQGIYWQRKIVSFSDDSSFSLFIVTKSSLPFCCQWPICSMCLLWIHKHPYLAYENGCNHLRIDFENRFDDKRRRDRFICLLKSSFFWCDKTSALLIWESIKWLQLILG